MSILMEPAGGVFSPEKVATINSAYQAAIDVIERRPSLKRGIADQTARVEVARAILRLAEQGEVDEGRLREKALFHLVAMQDPAS